VFDLSYCVVLSPYFRVDFPSRMGIAFCLTPCHNFSVKIRIMALGLLEHIGLDFPFRFGHIPLPFCGFKIVSKLNVVICRFHSHFSDIIEFAGLDDIHMYIPIFSCIAMRLSVEPDRAFFVSTFT